MWLTIRQIVEETGISDSTIRRYLRDHKAYLKTKTIGKKRTMVAEESVETLRKISALYDQGLTKLQVENELSRTEVLNIPVEVKANQISTLDEVLKQNHEELMKAFKALYEENQGLKQEMRDIKKNLTQIMQQLENQKKKSKWLFWKK